MIAAHATLTASTGNPTGHTLDLARVRVALAALTGATIDGLTRALCGLRGHSMMMHFEATRLSLHCANCGQATPGWAIQSVHRNVRSA